MATPETLNKDNSIILRVDKLKEKLKENPKNPENARIRGEIAELRRELNRTKQFTTITKENSKKIAEGKDMDSLSAAQLMKIDREEGTRGEFLSKSFLYKQTTDSEGNITQHSTDGKDLKEGEVLFIDFGKNKSANSKVGLGHMLPADIGYIKVNGKLGVRSIINNRVGYYIENNPKGYIPVFTGDTVSIPTATEISNFEKQKDAGLKRNSDQKISNSSNDLFIEKLERVSQYNGIELNSMTKESYDFWVEKGFSAEQAAGLVANEYQESRCNPRATNGTTFGIFQWKIDRINAIKAGSKIDILTANHKDQLNAALWEMTQTSESKVIEPLKKTKTAAEAAEVFVRIFERPGDIDNEVLKRGQMAEVFYYKAMGGVLEGPENKRIETLAMLAQNTGNIMGALHCTDWVDKIYLKATGKSVYEATTLYNGVTSVAGGTTFGGKSASKEQLSQINTGMHLMIDKPPYQSGKTHSVIALGKPIDGLVKVVSYPNGGIPPRVETYDMFAQGRGNKDAQVIRIQGVA